MPKPLGLSSLALIGTALLAGCGTVTANAGSSLHHSDTITSRSSQPSASVSALTPTTTSPSPSSATPTSTTVPATVSTRPSSSPSGVISTTFVPGIGTLPPANTAGAAHITVAVRQVLAPSQLVVNGKAVSPPTPQAEAVLVKMTITSINGGGAIIPIPRATTASSIN